jgi:hypothetical protein
MTIGAYVAGVGGWVGGLSFPPLSHHRFCSVASHVLRLKKGVLPVARPEMFLRLEFGWVVGILCNSVVEGNQ